MPLSDTGLWHADINRAATRPATVVQRWPRRGDGLIGAQFDEEAVFLEFMADKSEGVGGRQHRRKGAAPQSRRSNAGGSGARMPQLAGPVSTLARKVSRQCVTLSG
ncbi:MAG: hypothetical protein A3F78_03795 [Burkholderiales bacterium RIFCSPLOWO2_12_FULL_61_40]|nr:MAG: hypothetical protein A3F78_03795 [Burkholderiales bacterium RIFCSPLOWO2_12_FULL_61_40]